MFVAIQNLYDKCNANAIIYELFSQSNYYVSSNWMHALQLDALCIYETIVLILIPLFKPKNTQFNSYITAIAPPSAHTPRTFPLYRYTRWWYITYETGAICYSDKHVIFRRILCRFHSFFRKHFIYNFSYFRYTYRIKWRRFKIVHSTNRRIQAKHRRNGSYF